MSSPRRKLSVKDLAYVAGTDVTGSAALSLIHDGGIRCAVAISAPAIMYIRHNGQNIDVLDGELIPANSWRSFSLPFPASELFSVRFSANCTIRLLHVDEASDSNL